MTPSTLKALYRYLGDVIDPVWCVVCRRIYHSCMGMGVYGRNGAVIWERLDLVRNHLETLAQGSWAYQYWACVHAELLRKALRP